MVTSAPILRLTKEHEIPEIRELVENSDRHLYAERNFKNGACRHGFDNCEAVLAIPSRFRVDVLATWQRVEVRPPYCARVVNIEVRYIFLFKPLCTTIPDQNLLSSRDVFCGLEYGYYMCVSFVCVCVRACERERERERETERERERVHAYFIYLAHYDSQKQEPHAKPTHPKINIV